MTGEMPAYNQGAIRWRISSRPRATLQVMLRNQWKMLYTDPGNCCCLHSVKPCYYVTTCSLQPHNQVLTASPLRRYTFIGKGLS